MLHAPVSKPGVEYKSAAGPHCGDAYGRQFGYGGQFLETVWPSTAFAKCRRSTKDDLRSAESQSLGRKRYLTYALKPLGFLTVLHHKTILVVPSC